MHAAAARPPSSPCDNANRDAKDLKDPLSIKMLPFLFLGRMYNIADVSILRRPCINLA
jgi:hypothetical protein